jgi:pheromone a factor receptor
VFKEFLSKNTDMSHNRYMRLMLLAGTEAICTVPLTTYFLIRDVQDFVPYYGWANMHWGFHRVSQFPSILWRLNPQAVFGLEVTRWSPVLCAFIFFFFFAFAEEARKQYRLAFSSVAKRIGYSTEATMSTGITSSTTEYVPDFPTDVPPSPTYYPFSMRAKSYPHLLSNGKNMPFVQRETIAKRDSFGSFNLTIVDVGGALDDYKAPIYSPTASSSGSYSPQRTHSAISVSSPTSDGASPTSLETPAIPRPQPVLDITNVSRRSAESSPVRPSRPPSLHIPPDMV